MSPAEIVIRPARSDEAAALSELCLRAKAHWGYDASFLTAAARLLRIRLDDIRAGRVLVALPGGSSDAKPCGVAAIVPLRRSGWYELSHLFVEPENLRSGIGRTLFDAAIGLAARKGATHVSILSDPNAAAFYSKLGARHCGEAPSGVTRARMLPLFEFVIANRPEATSAPG